MVKESQSSRERLVTGTQVAYPVLKWSPSDSSASLEKELLLSYS
jgi:hypothetical protein